MARENWKGLCIGKAKAIDEGFSMASILRVSGDWKCFDRMDRKTGKAVRLLFAAKTWKELHGMMEAFSIGLNIRDEEIKVAARGGLNNEQGQQVF